MNWNCNRCEFEMVEVHKDTIIKIVKELNPKFLSLPKEWKSREDEWIQICPRCDTFPLGFGLEQGFPIRTRSGENTAIHELDFVKAHDHTEYGQEILESEICGCFSCCQTFLSDEIDQWHGEGIDGVEPLAQCPKCSIDSVIGSASGYSIEESFLRKMYDFWFSPSEWSNTMNTPNVD